MSPATHESREEITRLLEAWGQGDKAALDALVPVVHRELRRLGHRYMRDRAHFFAIAAQLMRRILVDLARSRRYAKRGGEAIRVTFEKALDVPDIHAPDWIALDDAMNALEALDPRKSRWWNCVSSAA
jgi:hypothetical protein